MGRTRRGTVGLMVRAIAAAILRARELGFWLKIGDIYRGFLGLIFVKIGSGWSCSVGGLERSC